MWLECFLGQKVAVAEEQFSYFFAHFFLPYSTFIYLCVCNVNNVYGLGKSLNTWNWKIHKNASRLTHTKSGGNAQHQRRSATKSFSTFELILAISKNMFHFGLMLFTKIWCCFVCIIYRLELSFEKAQQFADVYAHVLCVVERYYCVWTFSNRMDTVHGCPGDAVECVLSSWSRIRIVGRTVDIEVSFLKWFVQTMEMIIRL